MPTKNYMRDGGFLFYPIEVLEKKIIPGNIKDSNQEKKKRWNFS